jgi:DNA polymerase-1
LKLVEELNITARSNIASRGKIVLKHCNRKLLLNKDYLYLRGIFMSKLLIIDGHNLLFQMFFGMPSQIINKDGKAIHGTLGFIGAMLKLIRMTSPSHLMVLFDGEHENSRAQINEEYKANRRDYSTVSLEDNPFSQLEDIYKALDFIKIKYAEVLDYEADDCIASYAISYAKDMDIVISSYDSDFFQLINDNVSVIRYRGDNTTIYTPERIYEKFGVMPKHYADFKSLIGDKADNIRGADKIGPKTAAGLIKQLGNLAEIIKRADEIVRPSIKASIQKDYERLLQNYEIIKLDDKAKLPFQLDELKYSYNGITTNEVLQGIHLK